MEEFTSQTPVRVEENDQNEQRFTSFAKPEDYLTRLGELGLEGHQLAYQLVLDFSNAVQEAGGRALLVGGCVRDAAMGAISKDYDVEVYGLDSQDIEQLAERFGNVSSVGKAFGILKLSAGNGIDIDISLPRSDSKVAEGHKGFEVNTDPHMSIEDAARRRDFTMNSLAADPLTGELFDYFGGVDDLANRRLRVTDPERFRDDPLRVMRALQFIGRFGLEVEADTADIIREMAPQLRELPRERLGEEWKKLLLKSPKPSMALSAGLGLGVFHEIHPELPSLVNVEQEAEWHPEGDVWVHTMMVVDEAAKIIRREQLDEETAQTVMLAALAHDFGKTTTTEFIEGRWRSRGHEQAGVEPTHKFLTDIGILGDARERVTRVVADHLAPSMLFISIVLKNQSVSDGGADGAIRRLAQRLHPATIRELALVAEADHTGRGVLWDPENPQQLLLPDGFPAGRWLLERARLMDVEKSKPADLIRGRDLLAFGFKPGRNIGKMIALANDLRDEKKYTADIIFQALDGISSEDEAIATLTRLLEQG